MKKVQQIKIPLSSHPRCITRKSFISPVRKEKRGKKEAKWIFLELVLLYSRKGCLLRSPTIVKGGGGGEGA